METSIAPPISTFGVSMDVDFSYLNDANAALQPGLTSHEVSVLIRHHHHSVRCNLAKNQHVATCLKDALLLDSNQLVRSSLVSYNRLPSEWLLKLTKDPCLDVRKAVAASVDVTPGVMEALAADPDAGVRAIALSHRSASPELLMAHVRDPVDKVRERVAMHLALPSEGVSALLEDDCRDVIHEALRNPNLSIGVLSKLASSRSKDVRKGIAENPATPAALLAWLSNDCSEVVRAVAGNSNCSDELVGKLLCYPDVGVQHNLLANPACQADRLNAIWDLKSLSLKSRMLENPNVPIRCIEECMHQSGGLTHLDAVNCMRTPIAFLLELKVLHEECADEYSSELLFAVNKRLEVLTDGVIGEAIAACELSLSMKMLTVPCSLGDGLLAVNETDLYQRIQYAELTSGQASRVNLRRQAKTRCHL